MQVKIVYLATVIATMFSAPSLHAQGAGGLLRKPPEVTRPAGALGVVYDMAQALGSFRYVIPAGTLIGVNGVMYTAQGSATEIGSGGKKHTVDSTITTELTYYPYSQGIAHSPGMRQDLQGADSKGQQRRVWVASDGRAWNETEPGGKATAMPATVTERLAEIWMSPHGLIWAALSADGKSLASGVTTSIVKGNTVLTIPVANVVVQATLNADHRPTHVSARIKHATLGNTMLEFDYADYQDFEQAYGVYFPSHIVKKLAGHDVLNVMVKEFHTNPYSVFPLPAEVR